MGDSIVIVSMNCQGLGGKDKRKDVLNYLKKNKYSIYCLQDTHFTEKEENYIRTQWGFECYFSSYNSQSRGTAIFFNNNFEYKLHKIKRDIQGNKIVLDLTIANKKTTLINIYGPNNDRPNFYEEIKQDIRELDNENVIITGDFNLILDPEKDSKNYLFINNPRAREKVIDLCAEFNLIDIWRELNMEKSQYTWRTGNGNKQSRLDFFLITENLFTTVEQTEIEMGYRTDHSLIKLTLKTSEESKGRSFWKFNNSLLKDNEYIKMVKKVILDVKKQYIDEEKSPKDKNIEDLTPEELYLTINNQLFFEMILLEIRGKTISYSVFKKKQKDKKEEKLVREISELESNNEDINTITQKKNELKELRLEKLEGIRIRSRAKWIEQGEKVTKYFCNLENRNFISKSMPNLWKNNGTKTENQNEVIHETKTFYETLYKEKPVKPINLNNVLNYHDIPKLSESQKLEIEGEITTAEALNSLKNMKNNKSPGSDGFTTEFFKFFWKEIGNYLVKSINFGFINGELSVTQKEGIITCIPKGNKDKQFLKNWRPISLLNVTYKIASACIANRIKKFLPYLINEDQTGFIKGRYIGENTRNLYDLFHYTEKHHIPGLLLLIDFEKAFDSVAWTFISKTFDFFNFGPSIKRWINVFYNNIKSSVLVNGHVSEWFKIGRGCRQGDPLSPYIFILCAETLALLIRKNKNIRGITVGEKEHLLLQYADDTSLTIDATELSLRTVFNVLKFYADASGLQINIDKTRVIWFGSMKDSNEVLCRDLNLNWDSSIFEILGVKFSLNLKDMVQLNYDVKIREIKNLLIQWSKRNLTPYGRITVVKSLAISKINHLFLSLPKPDDRIIKELDSLFFKFIWNGSVDRVKRGVTVKNFKDGGLKMIKIGPFIDALKISWIRRLITCNSKWVHLFYQSYPLVEHFQNFGTEFLQSKIKNIDNKFWYEAFQAWIIFVNKLKPINSDDFLKEPIWHNNLLKVGGKPIFYKNWFVKGIYFINDLYDEQGNLRNMEYFQTELAIQTNFIEVHGLFQIVNRAKDSLSVENIGYKLQQPIYPVPIKILLLDKKGCQRIYQILIKNDIVPTSQRKWHNELLINVLNWENIYSSIYKCTKDTNIRWFQFRLIHRILSTNVFLNKIGIKDSNSCSFCNNNPETLIHLFYDCPHVKHFWDETSEWLKGECTHIRSLDLTTVDIIGGIQGKQRTDKALDFILIQAKYFIYKNKYNNQIPNLQHFKRCLLTSYKSEKYAAYCNCTWNSFNKTWMAYQNLINHLTS